MKIIFFFSFQITDEDELPKNICSKCRESLIDFYEFKLKCEESERLLFADNKTKIRLESVEIIAATSDHEDCVSIVDANAKENLEISKSVQLKAKRKRKLKKKSLAKDNKLPSRKICEHCGLSFVSSSVLKRHLTTHTGQKDFICDICDNRFARKFHLEMHLRTHFKLKPHKCDICEMSFRTLSDLNRHKLIHDDVKKFKCSVCDRRFKRSTDVTKHMRSHTGLKPYNCKTCDKQYASHSGLMKHLRRYHEDILAERQSKAQEKEAKEREILNQKYNIKLDETNDNKIECNVLYYT